MQITKYTDGATHCEVWHLSNSGWDDWAAAVDRFLAHAIARIVDAYPDSRVEWLEINGWPHSGRLIVFPSMNGPFGGRDERVCFELSSEHLEATCRQLEQEAYAVLSQKVWRRISECLAIGAAATELTVGRRQHRFRIAGFDYDPGEKLFWLSQHGDIQGEPGELGNA